MWPADADSLIAYQQQLAIAAPEPYALDPGTMSIGGCWVCFPRGLVGRGTDHDPAWCAAVIMFEGRVVEQQMISGTAAAPYVPGLMALRLGPLMEQAVRALSLARTYCCWTPRRVIIREELGWRCIWVPSWTFPRSG